MKMLKLVTSVASTNTYILYNDSNCVIVDPGDNAPLLFSTLEENGLKCKFVLLTHAHFDHCNVCSLLQSYGAKVFMHAGDKSLLRTDKNLAVKFGIAFKSFKPDYYVTDGQKLDLCGIEFTVVHTPGHTNGSVCYLAENFMFSGDTLFHLSVGRTDFPTGSDAKMRKSIKKLFALKKDYIVLPGHGLQTRLSYERVSNPYA